MARLLEGTQLTAEQRTYAAALRESGEHLLNLVNDVLDFAKLGEGAVELHTSVFDVESLLQGVCELLSPRAAEKGLEIAWSAPADAGAIRADENRLRQILLNFAGNAVKFTSRGGVRIRVARLPAGRLRFMVEDTGPGVRDADRERIFETFQQADAGRAEISGAGLGLAIARRLAQAMMGEVGVETAAGGGARFWFEAAFPRVATTPAPGVLEGRRVAVASPSGIVREAAAAQIEASGGEPAVAASAAALLEMTQPGDVALLDHALAGEDEDVGKLADRRCIVLLAAEERDRIEAYRQAGFSGYLIKPLRRASLAERVLIAAGAKSEAGEAAEDERIVRAAAPGARILLVEDNPINAMLARALLTREGCEVDHALDGGEAMAAVKVAVYDLILMDMRMPGMSGEETARRLRAEGLRTPIVALTANAFDDDRQACLAAGMDDFLVKPLSPDALRAALTRWTRSGGWTEHAARAKVG
jgi:CheY-like chemotaxis protein/anti-sigma regulatory factor (Ser/Thr protein kinase)